MYTKTRKVDFYFYLYFLIQIPAELLNKQMNEVLDQAAKDNLIYLYESIPKSVLERISVFGGTTSSSKDSSSSNDDDNYLHILNDALENSIRNENYSALNKLVFNFKNES